MIAEKAASKKKTGNLKIAYLRLQNFKGIKEFELKPEGKDISIFGDNATGKTTLYDAFLWPLFDKDSTGRSSFSIKTLDKNGEALHGLEHTVELGLLDGDKLIELKKTLTEKWTKKRGESDKIFTGHETAYWIDGVPCKAGDYKDYINGLIDESLFRLLTSPFYFPQALPWQERRNILLDACGDITDAEVIESSPELAGLPGILDGKSLDDRRKIIQESIRRLNKEIEAIPTRIDELTKSITGAEVNYEEAEGQLQALKTRLERIESRLTDAASIQDDYRALQQAVSQANSQLENVKFKLQNQNRAADDENARTITRHISDIRRSEEDRKNLLSRASNYETEIQGLQEQVNKLRQAWQDRNAETFISETTCPTCGQDLPAEKLEEAQAKFESKKKQDLETLNKDGKAKSDQISRLQGERDKTMEQVAAREADIEIAEESLGAAESKKAAPEKPINFETNLEYLKAKAALEEAQADLDKAPQDTSSELIEKKRELQDHINPLQAILNGKEQRERTLARIEVLRGEERDKAQEINLLEGQRYLTEQFVVAKVNLLEDRINSKFSGVSFKLFEKQINEGIKECCEVTINGVPFSDANRGASINAGLEIIQVLADHYGKSAPVFIDNAEAVTKLMSINSQVIKLVVSEADKVLRIK